MSSGHHASRRVQRSHSVEVNSISSGQCSGSNHLSVDNGPFVMAVTKKGRVRKGDSYKF